MPKGPQGSAVTVRRIVRTVLLPVLATAFVAPVLYVTQEPHLIVLGMAASVLAAGLLLRAADKRGLLPHA